MSMMLYFAGFYGDPHHGPGWFITSVRWAGFMFWGYNLAYAVVINYKILRNPRIHVVMSPKGALLTTAWGSIFHTWAVIEIFMDWMHRFPPTWRTPTLLLGGIIGAISVTYYGGIVRQRLSLAIAADRHIAVAKARKRDTG